MNSLIESKNLEKEEVEKFKFKKKKQNCIQRNQKGTPILENNRSCSYKKSTRIVLLIQSISCLQIESSINNIYSTIDLEFSHVFYQRETIRFSSVLDYKKNKLTGKKEKKNVYSYKFFSYRLEDISLISELFQ